jgi:hypothetical protein
VPRGFVLRPGFPRPTNNPDHGWIMLLVKCCSPQASALRVGAYPPGAGLLRALPGAAVLHENGPPGGPFWLGEAELLLSSRGLWRRPWLLGGSSTFGGSAFSRSGLFGDQRGHGRHHHGLPPCRGSRTSGPGEFDVVDVDGRVLVRPGEVDFD